MGDKSPRDFGDSSPELFLKHGAEPDFSGWATKAGIKCSDGRVILPNAFKHQDTLTVPLVWQHGHNDPKNILGHALLENRDEGVYAYGFFNDTDPADQAKQLVQHGDIKYLSIFANQLVEKAKQVSHGVIREVSLVLAGANPGALIDHIELQHADGELVEIEDEAIIYTGLELEHEDLPDPDADPEEELEHDEDDDTTVQDVYDSMTEEQKNVVHYMVGAAIQHSGGEAKHSDDPASSNNDNDTKEGRRMSRNVFEQQNGGTATEEKHVLTHDALRGIVEDAQRIGSLKEAFENYALKHGIENIDVLFPDAKTVGPVEIDKRRTEWVASVLNGTRHSPFSRIKSLIADITHDEARARGYIKGNLKKDEWFGLTKRVTTPTTVYKKQRLDRDDVLDITDLDVVAWLKGEMRVMLDEELARAILIGDGRAVDDEDKIRDPMAATEGAGIRAIANDHDLYAAKVAVDPAITPEDLVDLFLTNMQFYKGSGNPNLYTTQPILTKMLLARDSMTNRRMYRNKADLASEIGVNDIIVVEAMESQSEVFGVVVNLADYTVGADRGGDVAMFDDFDIDYNQYKYLIETRVSGALTKIRSAIVFTGTLTGVGTNPFPASATGSLPYTGLGVDSGRGGTNPSRPLETTATDVTPAAPTINASDVITIPNTAGVEYSIGGEVVPAGNYGPITEITVVDASAAPGSRLAANADTEWTFDPAAQ